jgi:hypothetical protein
MNRPGGLVFPAALAICLGFAGPGLWATAQVRGEVVAFGQLKSQVPTDWAKERPDKPSSYRQYRLEAIGEDKDAARLTIDFVGKGTGDSVEKQIERWKAMFLPPEGKKLNDVAKVRELKLGGAAVTYLDVRGDYKGIPGDPATPRENYRLLGVYFATPEGPYLIRLFGPAETVQFYHKEFESWLKAFK